MAVATASAAPARARRKTPPKRAHGVPAAFKQLEKVPALAESRDRLLRALLATDPSPDDAVRAIEGDIGLTIAMLRAANAADSSYRRGIATVPRAVEVLTPAGVERLARQIPTIDFFERLPGWEVSPETLRRHSVATQRVAEHLAADEEMATRDEIRVSALLHDVGKLLLGVAFPGYPDVTHAGATTPEDELKAERATLGLDHAAVGGVLVRRWGLPDRIADVVAHHHLPSSEGPTAIVSLADLLVHYAHGDEVSAGEILGAAQRVGLDESQLRSLMQELPCASDRPRVVDECPLSKGELVALRGLARGHTYKELAASLDRSTSTIRTQLHNTYKKLGVRDRAQAVLLASEHGWL
jgi:putative nucleotidyltransferase with HDIG domain